MGKANRGGNGLSSPAGIATDGDGDVILAGNFEVSIDFGCGVINGPNTLPNRTQSVFVAKLDGAGNCLWSKGFGEPDLQQTAYGVAVGPNGDVSVTGLFSGKIDFGGGPLAGSFFVAEFDPAGAYRWSHGIAGQYAVAGSSGTGSWMAASGTAIFIAGGFNSPTLSLPGQVLTLGSRTDTYLASFVP